MEKNGCGALKVILAIIGAIAVIGAIAIAVVHFWDDIKKWLPCKKEEVEFEDFEDLSE